MSQSSIDAAAPSPLPPSYFHVEGGAPSPVNASHVVLSAPEYERLRVAASAGIRLTAAEIQSGMDRVKWAEGLILQLPETHDGRNSWLLNYGVGPVSDAIRKRHPVLQGRRP